MKTVQRPGSPEYWIGQVFGSKSANTGGVVRRSAHWIEREIGRERFLQEVRDRGFHAIECGGQIVVIRNASGLRVLH